MTGPEHYIAAQEALSAAEEADPLAYPSDIALMLKFAAVHASLAQAAATASAHIGIKDAPAGWANNDDWAKAIS